MKEKFSIFSPPPNRSEPSESSINFKKSPNKFAVYEQLTRPKESGKGNALHAVSATNLDNLRKLPSEYSTLRQTMNFKTSDFEGWMHDDDKDKQHKPNNILRQTLSMKPAFKPKPSKNISESYSSHEVHSTPDLYLRNETGGVLGYTRKPNSYLAESKSWHTLYDPKTEDRTLPQDPPKLPDRKDWKPEDSWKPDEKQKWRTPQAYKPLENHRHERILEQIQQLKKISKNHQQEQKPRHQFDRKFSCKETGNYRESEEISFRKKTREQETPADPHTPKVPKFSTYDDKFKKIASPTSTDNSDSRSPPNKFLEVDLKRKGRLSMEDFVLGKTLGEGKFGVVSMARHIRSGSLVALKKIPKAIIRSHLMVEQLCLEIKLQSWLNHKNILGMYGFFDDHTHLYIVLEYMEQGTLYAQLKKNKILQETAAAVIVAQIAQAVQYLHDQDIAHRDIKPENIVLSNNVCKLCDFGWATLCNERRKTYCGTFDYAAPEIIEGKEYDMSVDLWCLGVLTFELLTGKAPFYHLSRKETVKKILNVEMQSITYPETMSAVAVDFIEKLVRKDPNERMKAGEALKHPFLAAVQEL